MLLVDQAAALILGEVQGRGVLLLHLGAAAADEEGLTVVIVGGTLMIIALILIRLIVVLLVIADHRCDLRLLHPDELVRSVLLLAGGGARELLLLQVAAAVAAAVGVPNTSAASVFDLRVAWRRLRCSIVEQRRLQSAAASVKLVRR